MFHSAATAGYTTDANTGFHAQHHLQQSPVYVPGNRAAMPQYPSPAAASGHFGAAQSSWHAPAGYGDMSGTTAHGHAGALAGQFYAAQNMMMGGWRPYDASGFQRTSPYGNYRKCFLYTFFVHTLSL